MPATRPTLASVRQDVQTLQTRNDQIEHRLDEQAAELAALARAPVEVAHRLDTHRDALTHMQQLTEALTESVFTTNQRMTAIDERFAALHVRVAALEPPFQRATGYVQQDDGSLAPYEPDRDRDRTRFYQLVMGVLVSEVPLLSAITMSRVGSMIADLVYPPEPGVAPLATRSPYLIGDTPDRDPFDYDGDEPF